jgi:hypothetical protein
MQARERMFHDALRRRVRAERWAVSKIRFFWMLCCFKRAARLRASVRRIQRWYRRSIADRIHKEQLALLTRKIAARTVVSFFNNAFGPSFAAVRFKSLPQPSFTESQIAIAQRVCRSFVSRQRARRLQRQNSSAIAIQKIARGALVRMSDVCTLLRLYRTIHPFWRKFMQVPLQCMSNKLVDTSQVQQLHAQVHNVGVVWAHSWLKFNVSSYERSFFNIKGRAWRSFQRSSRSALMMNLMLQ